jgi:hypothetical protein
MTEMSITQQLRRGSRLGPAYLALEGVGFFSIDFVVTRYEPLFFTKRY